MNPITPPISTDILFIFIAILGVLLFILSIRYTNLEKKHEKLINSQNNSKRYIDFNLSNKRNLEIFIETYEYCSSKPKEIIIGVIDENGFYLQDLVAIRPNELRNDTIDTIVYANGDSDDYTNKFEIKLFDPEHSSIT